MGEQFASIASGGPLVLAVAVAALAGLVSILSPCVLPLVPGYLSYVTGLAGSDLDSREETREEGGGVATVTRTRVQSRGRVLAGTSLFVLGFAVVFILLNVVVANVGFLLRHQDALNVVLGIMIIVLGLGYLGWIPGLQREVRISKLPAAGLLGAPVFGAIFALSWAPCVGPTLGAVMLLGATSGQTDRAVILAIAYSLGLGLPFVLFGLFFSKLLGVFRAIRRNSRWVTRVGGALLILVGLALVTGGWNDFLIWLKTTFDFSQEGLL
ncbi:cytochrome c biogenesis protein CcdA [Actinoplanes sp. NPDC049596]|uniref:cytochrome c biogenesis CcdA family protein n=1 Tax=unclassified Actinoplanes TaxID=2626549 RepID=UPI003421D483